MSDICFPSNGVTGFNVALSDDGNMLFVGGIGILHIYNLAIDNGFRFWSNAGDHLSSYFTGFLEISISSAGSYLVAGDDQYQSKTGTVVVLNSRSRYDWKLVGGRISGEMQGD